MNMADVFPTERIPISSPAELAAVLRMARESVLAGTLRQTNPMETLFPRLNIANISDVGPWPDLIEMQFEDADGARYRLSVETFHGAGGEWLPLDHPNVGGN